MDGSKTTRTEAFSNIYSFDQYFLNPEERRLARAGKYIDVKPRTYDVLTFLVANAGKAVNKDEILETVWEDRFVEEGNLAVHVSRLRKMFRTTGGKNSIQTISGAGYQFVEPVEIISKRAWKKAVAGAPPIFDPYAFDKDCESIAIMPLLNENGDPEIDYIADGLTEALINNLACRGSIRVLARNTVFQFKGEEIDIKEVGKRLNVANIVTGRIRMSNDNMSLSVELARTSDGTQVWGDQFNRQFSEVFEMQDSITNSICENLNTELKRAAGKLQNPPKITETESYRLFLKGTYFANQGGLTSLRRAIELLNESVNADPFNVNSYAELANCYLWLYFYEDISRAAAIELTEKMLCHTGSISNSPQTLLIRGCIDYYLNWEHKNAARFLRAAIQLNPSSAQARYYFANLLANSFRFEDAIEQLKVILQLDPISITNTKNVAKVFYKMGRSENALVFINETLDLEPLNYEALLVKGAILAELREYKKAISNLEAAIEIHRHPEAISMLGFVCGLKGDMASVRAQKEQLELLSQKEEIPPTYFGLLELASGDKSAAIGRLQTAIERKYPDALSLGVDPRWKSLRKSSRFRRLLKSAGLLGGQ